MPEQFVPTLFDNGISAGVILLLAYLLYYVLKKMSEASENASEREKVLMAFVMEYSPTQERILALVREIKNDHEASQKETLDMLCKIDDKITLRKKWQ